MKTYYSVEYTVQGIGSSVAWFNSKAKADRFHAAGEHRDKPVAHKSNNQEVLDEYNLLAAQTAEWIKEREEEGEALLDNINRQYDWGGARPGSGRPEMEDKRKARSIKFTDAEWEEVKEKADAANVTISEYIRRRSLD